MARVSDRDENLVSVSTSSWKSKDEETKQSPLARDMRMG
jgi:hypothetical protein